MSKATTENNFLSTVSLIPVHFSLKNLGGKELGRNRVSGISSHGKFQINAGKQVYSRVYQEALDRIRAIPSAGPKAVSYPKVF